jgi:hypothetical protein
MHSAARTLVEAGEFWSSMIFIKVVAAADEPCWRRAIDCPNAARRASRYAVWKFRYFHPPDQSLRSDACGPSGLLNVPLHE